MVFTIEEEEILKLLVIQMKENMALTIERENNNMSIMPLKAKADAANTALKNKFM